MQSVQSFMSLHLLLCSLALAYGPRALAGSRGCAQLPLYLEQRVAGMNFLDRTVFSKDMGAAREAAVASRATRLTTFDPLDKPNSNDLSGGPAFYNSLKTEQVKFVLSSELSGGLARVSLVQDAKIDPAFVLEQASLRTPKGLGLGSTLEEVRRAYGGPHKIERTSSSQIWTYKIDKEELLTSAECKKAKRFRLSCCPGYETAWGYETRWTFDKGRVREYRLEFTRP
jgi:hypothetical protein